VTDLLEGKCLCGGVVVRLPAAMNDVGVCHCRMCRRWGGGPWMALQAPGSLVSGDTLVVYRSSGFAERAFCGRCGAHIFHRPQDGPEQAISAGLFNITSLQVKREIFYDAKPPYYRFETASEKRSTASMAREWLPRILHRRIVRWLTKAPAPRH